jgi:phage baseplate assembly protein gpV
MGDLLGVSYKTGIVAEARPGFTKVRFDDLDGLVTDWLANVGNASLSKKRVWTYAVGEHVACVLDANLEDGCVLGAIYSEADQPPTPATSQDGLWFPGGKLLYDAIAQCIQIQFGACSIVINATGIRVTGGDVVANEKSLEGHLHGGVVPGGSQTSPPV